MPSNSFELHFGDIVRKHQDQIARVLKITSTEKREQLQEKLQYKCNDVDSYQVPPATGDESCDSMDDHVDNDTEPEEPQEPPVESPPPLLAGKDFSAGFDQHNPVMYLPEVTSMHFKRQTAMPMTFTSFAVPPALSPVTTDEEVLFLPESSTKDDNLSRSQSASSSISADASPMPNVFRYSSCKIAESNGRVHALQKSGDSDKTLWNGSESDKTVTPPVHSKACSDDVSKTEALTERSFEVEISDIVLTAFVDGKLPSIAEE